MPDELGRGEGLCIWPLGRLVDGELGRGELDIELLGRLVDGELGRGELDIELLGRLVDGELWRGELDIELLGRLPPGLPGPPGRRPCALEGTARAMAAAVNAIDAIECKYFLSIV